MATWVTMASVKAVFAGALAILASLCACTADEMCHSYAGGDVYPQETNKAATHSLHYSKALSKYAGLSLGVAGWCSGMVVV